MPKDKINELLVFLVLIPFWGEDGFNFYKKVVMGSFGFFRFICSSFMTNFVCFYSIVKKNYFVRSLKNIISDSISEKQLLFLPLTPKFRNLGSFIILKKWFKTINNTSDNTFLQYYNPWENITAVKIPFYNITTNGRTLLQLITFLLILKPMREHYCS